MSAKSSNMNRKSSSVTVLLSAFLLSFASLWSTQASAVALGDFSLNSPINEPLDATIEIMQLNGLDESQVLIGLASSDDFARTGIERLPFLEDIQFEFIAINSESGVIHLTTEEAILEPYIDIIIDLRWPSGRMQREYALLLDLPVFSEAPVTTEPVQAPEISEFEPVLEAEPEPLIVLSEDQPVIEEITEVEVEEIVQERVPEPVPEIELEQAEPQFADEVVEVIEPSGEANEELSEEVETIIEEVADISPSNDLTLEESIDTSTVPGFEPSGQNEYRVQVNDTLWEIALENRADDSVSVHQMMLAIQRENEEAFIGNNINLVKAGQVLRIPDLSQILTVNQQEAINEVAFQNQSFSGDSIGGQPLAVNGNEFRNTSNELVDELTVVTEADALSSEEDGQSLNMTIEALETQLMISEENLDRVNIENQDLDNQLSELNAQIELLENIIQIEDQRIAELQSELASRALDNIQTNENLINTEEEINQDISSETDQSQEPSNVVASVNQQETTTDKIKSLLNNNLLLAGLGIVLVALSVFFLMSRRNRDEEYDDEDYIEAYENSTEQGFEDEDDEGEDQVYKDDFDEDLSEGLFLRENETETLDSTEEDADLNELINEDLSQDDVDDNSVVPSEEVELDSDSDDDKRNSKILSAISSLMGKKSDDESEEEDSLNADLEVRLEEDESDQELMEESTNFVDLDKLEAEDEPQIETLGADLDLETGLEDFAVEQESEQKTAEASLEDSLNEIDRLAETGELEISEDEVQELEETIEELEVGTLDIDAEGSLPDAEGSLSDAEGSLHAEGSQDNDGLSFVPEQASESLSSEIDENIHTEELKIESEPELEALEFSLDDTSEEADNSVNEIQSSNEEAEEETVEFSVDPLLDETTEQLDSEQNSDEGKAGQEDDDMEVFDFGNLTLDENSFDGEEEQEQEQEKEILNDIDPVASKLDLAVAYQAMGDMDFAKSELEEVIATGNDSQVSDAKKLLEEWEKE